MKIKGISESFDRLVREAEREPRPALAPWMKAAVDGDLTAVRALIAEGADVDATTAEDEASLFYEGGRTALMFAATRGHTEIVRALLDAGASLDLVAANGDTALTIAASADDHALETVRLLVDRGASFAPKRAKFTPLYNASRRGDRDLVRYLLEAGALVDAPIWTKETPLMAAAKAGAVDVMHVLLGAGASVGKRNKDGASALMLAVEARKPDAVAVLLAAGADVRTKGKGDRETALHRAASQVGDSFELARLLLEAGAPVDARNAARETPLAKAAAIHATGVAALLLERGAKPNAADRGGVTPLMRAAKNGYVDLVNVLLRAGADETRVSVEGETAPELARKSRRDGVLPLLAREGPLPPVELARPWLVDLIRRATTLAPEEQRRAYEVVPRLLRESVFAITSNYAYALQQCGEHSAAARHFELAMAAQPQKAHLPRAACFSYDALEDWPSMLRCARRAVELAEGDDYAWQQLAIAHERLGDISAARAAGDRAVALNPNNTSAAANLARLRADDGK